MSERVYICGVPMATRWKIGIVGGGPGGLFTSYLMQKSATSLHEITIYEASARLGGKILTAEFQTAHATYEVGAAELYDYSPVGEDALSELVEELGLPTCPMNGSAVILHNHVVSNLEELRALYGPSSATALQNFDRFAKDSITPAEFYYSDHPEGSLGKVDERRFDAIMAKIPETYAREYIQTMIHSDLATEPRRTNVDYGLHNYLMNDPAYMLLYSIPGGNERIPRELANRIRAKFLLEHTVQRIGKNSDGTLRITAQHAGETRHDDFDFVVVALPNPCLPRIQYDGDRLTAAVRKHHDHYDHPAHYLRITILFSEPFWRGVGLNAHDSYWMLDQFGGCCLYDESSRTPGSPNHILGWLIGGKDAQELSLRSDTELVQLALDSLPQFLARGKELVREAHVHRWIGAVNAMPGGVTRQPIDRRHQPEPHEHANLFLVGDYLFDSTLNGVLDSAEHVSNWISGIMLEIDSLKQVRTIHD